MGMRIVVALGSFFYNLRGTEDRRGPDIVVVGGDAESVGE